MRFSGMFGFMVSLITRLPPTEGLIMEEHKTTNFSRKIMKLKRIIGIPDDSNKKNF